ncbi:MMPL family transporter, partial [bacterium]|nr:MMPL family transporter [bacterium]
EWDAWDEALLALEGIKQEDETFKDPEVLRYIENLQAHLGQTGLVGKSNSLPDIVKTVYRELLMGEDEAFRIPDTPAAVAQTLITFQSSHRPQDLWHFVTPDYRRTSLWLQLKSGDNVDMKAVTTAVDRFISENPPPVPLDHEWFGLTYINVVWQQKMVSGMLRAFLGSFLVVLAMMAFLFRSFWWGLLSMVPLTFTIAAIYGLIGIVGKDYDMPVAILSSLSLGLAIDYAIHFLARSRALREEHETWKDTVTAVFGEPARCIARNVIVIGVGFLPLLAAPLLPYRTVGVFISAILLLAGIASLFILPALLTVFEGQLFKITGILEKEGEAT